MLLIETVYLPSGGTIVTISGSYLNSIAPAPVINVTVVVTRIGTNNQAATISQSSTFLVKLQLLSSL